MNTHNNNSHLSALVAELQQIHALGEAAGLLSWDEQVNLPPGATEARAAQLAALSDVIHQRASSTRLGELLVAAEQAAAINTDPALTQQSGARTPNCNSKNTLDNEYEHRPEGLSTSTNPVDSSVDTRCILQHARKAYDRAVKIPPAFAAKKAAASSRSYHAWKEARAQNDFAKYRPHLEEQLDLAFEEAGYLGYDSTTAYDYFLDRYDPGLTQAYIEPLFDQLRSALPAIAAEALANSAEHPPLAGFPVDRQEAFLREVVTRMGFDSHHGRIDVAVHPFCSGGAYDCRLTTRYDVDNPLDALCSAIHEAGHGLYEQGLPKVYLGTALGEAAGMATHESQSRLWENQVARSREFWQHWEGKYRSAFNEQLAGLDSDSLYQAIVAVRKEPIRVDSDEVHYNLHIILRYELEKRLFRRELAIADLPEAWNALSEELLGITPRNYAEGCLQDVHWSEGYFGYFPSYTLGNLLAAQLWETISGEIPDISAQIARGEMAPLLAWLRTNIHQHGKRYTLPELCNKVTGKPLQTSALLAYLRERYAPGMVLEQ